MLVRCRIIYAEHLVGFDSLNVFWLQIEDCNVVMNLWVGCFKALDWRTSWMMSVCFVSQLLAKEHVEAGTAETYGDFDNQVCTCLECCLVFMSFLMCVLYCLLFLFLSFRPSVQKILLSEWRNRRWLISAPQGTRAAGESLFCGIFWTARLHASQ